jgi:hypothetical protein
MQNLQLRSPKATQIKNIAATPDRAVKSGDLLLELFDFEELKLESSINRQIAENSAKLAEVMGDRVKKKVEYLQNVLWLREQAVVTAIDIRDLLLLAWKTPGLPVPGIRAITADHTVTMRIYERNHAKIDLALYQRNVADSIAVFKNVDALLHRELGYIETMRKRLSILAPRNGKFKCYVSAGDPVPRGFLIGEIE